MKSRHAKTIFLLLIVLVMFLFFFHTQGGFQSKNGPTTPVNNLRVALAGLFLLLTTEVISSLFTCRCLGLLSWRPAALDPLEVSSGSFSLRC